MRKTPPGIDTSNPAQAVVYFWYAKGKALTFKNWAGAMNLPNREDAWVPSEKISGYLLSDTHPVGKSKARVFRAVGFTEPGVLAEQLLAVGHTC